MDKRNLMPQPSQPVNRFTTGQLPPELAELSEEALQQQGDDAFGASVLPQIELGRQGSAGELPIVGGVANRLGVGAVPLCLRVCSYDGEDGE